MVMDLELGIGYYKIFNPTNKWFEVTFHIKSSKGIKTIKPGKMPLICNMT
jgi:catalase